MNDNNLLTYTPIHYNFMEVYFLHGLNNAHVLEQSSGPGAGEIAGGVIGVLVAVILIKLLIIPVVVLMLKGRRGSHLTDTQGRSSTMHYNTSCKDNILSTTQHA